MAEVSRSLALVYADQDKAGDAIPHLQRALASEALDTLTEDRLLLADLALREQHYDQAVKQADLVLASLGQDQPSMRVRTLAISAEAHRGLGDMESARAAAEQAVSLLEALDEEDRLGPLAARAHFALAKALDAAGHEPKQARETAERALDAAGDDPSLSAEIRLWLSEL